MGKKALPHDQPKKIKKEKALKVSKESKDIKKDSNKDEEPGEHEDHSSQKRFYDSRSAANPKKKSSEGNLKLKVRALKDPQEPTMYLRLWKSDVRLWKFNKNLQNWLLTNMYDTNKVDPDTFDIMVEYCKDMKGASRQWAEDDSKTIMDLSKDLEAQIAAAAGDAELLASLKREAGRMKKRQQRASKLSDALTS